MTLFLHLQLIPPQLPLIGLNNKPKDIPEAMNDMNMNSVSKNVSINIFISKKRGAFAPLLKSAKI
tara:strand:+ start:955 stop:1149 length:195 start_codon:yes stop_codon:yes gene_type:complete